MSKGIQKEVAPKSFRNYSNYRVLRPVRFAMTLLLDVVAPIYELLVGSNVAVIVTEPRANIYPTSRRYVYAVEAAREPNRLLCKSL